MKLIRLMVLSNGYKFIGRDLSKQTNTTIPQQIKKIEKENAATMFFTAEKQQESILNVPLDSLTVTE